MIEIKNLSKQYGQIKALKDINLRFSKGEIVFLVGPNGAGKSTLMRLISGYLHPSSGQITIAKKYNNETLKARSYFGYVPENCPLYYEMNVYEYIHFAAKLRGMSDKKFLEKLPQVIENLELSEVLTQKIETLSKGFRRRVGIAGALIHDPEILLLDEPTEGLDPNQKYKIHQLFKEYGRRRLIVVSSHLMEEVEAIADRVILLNQGQVIWDGVPEELKYISSDKRLETAFRLLTREA